MSDSKPRPGRVLIVDDDPVVRTTLQEVLDGDGLELFFASGAEEALRRAELLEHLDVVLVDKNMPDGSGLDVARALVARTRGPEVIVMTAYASVASAVESMHIGVFDYMPKPFDDLAKIRRTVRNAVHKRQLEREQSRLTTELVRRNEELRHMAMHDELTSLPNRAVFRDRLGRLIERCKRDSDYRFAVLFLDLDRFKMVNDSLGHRAGDELLVALARRLDRCIRTVDTVARHGGDEFTILLDGISGIEDAALVAERILHELSRPFQIDDHEVFTSCSIGIALGGEGQERPEELERDADIAMYRAKASGGSQHLAFSPEMHERAVELLYLHTAMHRALDREEFTLHYQPVVDVQRRRVVGLEALIRWDHPDDGLLLPGQFIAVAEETGLIEPIGHWVLEHAIRQAVKWQKAFGRDLTISVNLSAQQFRRPDLVSTVSALLSRAGLKPSSLHIEVTESVLMDNSETATRLMSQLKELGVGLDLDDFGTGFSSLSYLHRFPFDFLKIDRTFVMSMVDERRRNIVEGIVDLANRLGIGVIAEGVETEQQLAILTEIGCDHMQGFHFARPMDPDATKSWLQSALSSSNGDGADDFDRVRLE